MKTDTLAQSLHAASVASMRKFLLGFLVCSSVACGGAAVSPARDVGDNPLREVAAKDQRRATSASGPKESVNIEQMRTVLQDYVTEKQAQLRTEMASAYGLQTPSPTLDANFWPLQGCRAFSDAEKQDAQRRVEAWVSQSLHRDGFERTVKIAPGCWVGEEGVFAASFWTMPANDDGKGHYEAIFVLHGNALELVEQMHQEALSLTSAGDVDDDGHLDVAYTRPRAKERSVNVDASVVVRVGGSSSVLGDAPCPRAVFVKKANNRGVAIGTRGSCSVPVGSERMEAWRFAGANLVPDVELAVQLTESTRDARVLEEKRQSLQCLVKARPPSPRSSDHDHPRAPPACSRRLVDASVATLRPPASVVAAVQALKQVPNWVPWDE